MIVSQLVGGLGNQLFQYAAGRCLAEACGAELGLDLSAFTTYGLHDYSLQHFRIIGKAVTPDMPQYPVRVFKEANGFQFDPAFNTLRDGIVLNGYWQSEKYFAAIADTIRDEFQVIHSLTGNNLELAERISSTNSVSIHVRRGDYVSNSYSDQILESLDLEYYHRSLEELCRVEDDLHCFVFSDDPTWVRTHLRPRIPATYVSHNEASANYEDLRLMTLCRHNIIANSTFSWWGAWLNANKGKRVFAPTQWLSANARQLVVKDLIPESWTRVEA